jgi:peptidoglycan L-alanyl-D-glutamate endopeptidase CwlK
MDNITLERIKTLHPKIRQIVLNAYIFCNNKLLGKGVRLRFAYTTRTNEEQNELFAQGRTKLFDKNGKRLGIVTKAKGGQSIHNYHLAFDIVLLLDKNGDGVFESASWDTILDFDKDGISDWMEVTNYFKSIGFVWGGDWKFKDAPHFEMTFGHTWRTLKQLVDSGQAFTETINGKTYTYAKI